MKGVTYIIFPFVRNFPPSWKSDAPRSFCFTKTRPHRYRRMFQKQSHSFGRGDQTPKERIVQRGMASSARKNASGLMLEHSSVPVGACFFKPKLLEASLFHEGENFLTGGKNMYVTLFTFCNGQGSGIFWSSYI